MNKKLLIGSSLVGILSLGLFTYSNYDSKSSVANLQSINSDQIPVYERHADFVMDVTNKEEVVGNSENVFIAKVLNLESSIPTSNVPRTQFKVEVIQNIKGELNNEIIINQAIGYGIDQEGNKYMEKHEGQEFIKEGSTYLFATLHDENTDWHNPVPIYGEINISNSEIENTVKEYKLAFENQKPSELLLEQIPQTLNDGYKENE